MSKFIIPEGALAQHAIILGKTGSGKSSKARLAVEHFLDKEVPVCVIDPKGDWWGLKSSADGKKAGYPIIIFGSEWAKHADVRINKHSGAAIGELVATGNRPCVIDMKGMTVGDRGKFFIDFADSYFRHATGKRVLMIDECHNFAPQGKILDPQSGMVLHWANRLISEGRGIGITVMSASQRPQKVHKDFVTSHETLIACRVIHELDRESIEGWLKACGNKKIAQEMMESIAGMPRTDAWVYSPEIGFGPKRVTFPMFSTYDSFKPQDHHAPKKLKGWAAIDLADVESKIATVVEEAKANDPKALKAKIIELETKLRKSASAQPAVTTNTATKKETGEASKRIAILRNAIEVAMKFIIEITAQDFFKGAPKELDQKAISDAIEKAVDQVKTMAERRLQERGTQIERVKKEAEQITKKLKALLETADSDVTIKVNVKQNEAFTVSPQAPKSLTVKKPEVTGEDRQLGAERRILAVLAGVSPAGMTEGQWAAACKMTKNGGTWKTYRSRLNKDGRIELRGILWHATDQGMADIGTEAAPMPPAGPQLIEYWADRVGGGKAGDMLRRIAEVYPAEIKVEQLAVDLSMTAEGGTFKTYLSRCRAPGLVEGKTAVKATPLLIEGVTA